jgi:hypothetical protein
MDAERDMKMAISRSDEDMRRTQARTTERDAKRQAQLRALEAQLSEAQAEITHSRRDADRARSEMQLSLENPSMNMRLQVRRSRGGEENKVGSPS